MENLIFVKYNYEMSWTFLLNTYSKKIQSGTIKEGTILNLCLRR